MKRLCLSCDKDISKRHPNAKRCKPCASRVRATPPHKLTKEQQAKALRLAGKMYRREIAEKIGCSRASLARFAKGHPEKNWNGHKYTEKIVAKVVEYYLSHTLKETQEKFPKYKVRSIVDRYISQVKCLKWKEAEILMLYKYTGLTSWKTIADKLGRSPYAPKRKRERVGSGSFNILDYHTAKNYVTSGCPFYHVSIGDRGTGRWITPWVTAAKFLKQDNPAWVNQAVLALAKFQKWLHGSESNIERILRGEL